MAVFDPRDTEAKPDLLDQSAEGFYSVAGKILGRSGDMEQVLNGAAMNFSDLVAYDIWKQNEYNAEDWRTAAEAAVYGAGVTKGWAQDVREFKRKRQALVDEWEDAAGSNFGVVRRLPDTTDRLTFGTGLEQEMNAALDEEYAADRAQAEAAKLRELSGAADRAWEELQARAELRERQLAQGPTPQNLRSLVEHDLLGWAPYNIRGAEAPLPLDAELAAADAALLREYLTRRREPDAEYGQIIGTLLAAVRQGVARRADGGRLDPDVLAYLEEFYGELGSDLLVMDAYAGHGEGLGERPFLQQDSLAALGGGLLLLSDESVGGGFDRMPPIVRRLFDESVQVNDGAYAAIHHWGYQYAALADLLGSADPRLVAGEELSTALIAVTPHYLDFAGSPVNVIPGGVELLDGSTVLTDEPAATMLGVATRNVAANHAVLTGDYEPGDVGLARPELLAALYTHDWSDDGAAAAKLTSWIHADGVDETMAGEAAAGLYETVTGVGDGGVYGALTDGPGGDSMGMLNPELSRGFADVAVKYLDEFAAEQDDPARTSFGGGNLELAYEDGARARFFELVAGDEDAAAYLTGAVLTHEATRLNGYVAGGGEGDAQYGRANGMLRGYLDAGMLNEAMDRTGDERTAVTDAAARQANGSTFASGMIKETVGNVFPWGRVAKVVIGTGNEIWRAGVRAQPGPSTPLIQAPNGERVGRTDLEQGGLLNLVSAAVTDGRISAADVPDVLRSGDPDAPVKLYGQVPGHERRAAEDAAAELLDDVLPGYRDLLEKQEDAYSDAFNGSAAADPQAYEDFVRTGIPMAQW
ncbi:TPR repeat region-containing protein [Actinomadura algeriensis]|uniref:TPR repeat domain-containing protein n=1 Tax=Actinomadura algeriensis TaxID=1679523 RepID=A0ABR9JNE2_9ACTN|nr:hypothetical protein [Actinomadura algeriensis]MBE1532091.1 hypothetical protein [Actinomadura algeriensis]